MTAIIVESHNQRVPDINVLALFPNQTWKYLQTNERGVATPRLHNKTLPMTVFAAAEGYKGVVKEDWVPTDGDLKLEVKELPSGGSCIFPELDGRIPGLSGRLQATLNPGAGGNDTPIQVNTTNLAVNGKNPPITYVDFGQVIDLTDSDGVTLSVSIRTIVGKSVLLDWWREHQ